jgi:hypothetical protein
MSAAGSQANLTNDEYDARRRFLEELKGLTKTEHSKVFQILRETDSEFSENSNGIFFDVAKVSDETFRKLQGYMEFCRTIRRDQAEREAEMEGLRD